MPRPVRIVLVLSILAAAVAAGFAAAPHASRTVTVLNGVVGPDQSISLKDAQGAAVTSLPEGDYQIVVDDRSTFHDFHLFGPGVNEATQVESTGTVTWNVHLQPGAYTFQCDPHASVMNGKFQVTGAGGGGSTTTTTTTTTAKKAAGAAAAVLIGKVGPGFSISLSRNGKRVTSLKAGRYTVRVADRSPIHNFVLEKSGGAVERQVTTVPFVGSKSITLTLVKGRWEVYCRPHESQMHQSFNVT